MNDARISRDNNDIRKYIWYWNQVSPFAEDNSSIGSIAARVIANEVEKMTGKDVFKYSLKHTEKVINLPIKTSVNPLVPGVRNKVTHT